MRNSSSACAHRGQLPRYVHSALAQQVISVITCTRHLHTCHTTLVPQPKRLTRINVNLSKCSKRCPKPERTHRSLRKASHMRSGLCGLRILRQLQPRCTICLSSSNIPFSRQKHCRQNLWNSIAGCHLHAAGCLVSSCPRPVWANAAQGPVASPATERSSPVITPAIDLKADASDSHTPDEQASAASALSSQIGVAP